MHQLRIDPAGRRGRGAAAAPGRRWHDGVVKARTLTRSATGLVLLLTVAFAPTSPPAAAGPLAEVNGEPITAEEVERALGARLSHLEEQIYDLRKQQLEAMITDRLLAQEAARRGIDVAALLDAEVRAKVEVVTDAEIDTLYRANKARLRGDEDSLRQSIRTHLEERKTAARKREFVASLRQPATVVVHLRPPPVTRVTVSTDGAPSRGAREAPVILVEFSDFHCPFCKRAQATLKRVLDKYPGKVRHVFRDFPMDSLHPDARRAAEAARCAQDQGKFWEFHDVLFANAPSSSTADLRRYAERVGLDVTTFEGCLSAGGHRATVQRDVDEGERLGVSGTPAFFINGRPLHGAQPLDAFARMIEEELARP
jgi:protein-disulfide isomerase